MQIKRYSRQGFVCWSNSKSHSELFLSAALEPDEQSLYNLDICLLDMQERNKEVTVIGNGYSTVPFRCVAWDVFGEKQNTYPHGLIFGGMENGSYSLWNPNQIINSYHNREDPSPSNVETQAGLIYEEEAEDNAFPIMCAEWNSLKNNFLAFGSTDVLILDVSKDVENAQIVKPGKKNPHEGSYVTSVAWNKEVAHILASASENGLIALWDIKTDSSIFQFKDTAASTSGSRNVVICWSKKISTQIAVTLDDDKRNELQIWDLRNQKGPIVVIDKPHSKGINAMDWCETDPELILTGGRDGKVVCWNYTQDEKPLSESQLKDSILEVKWSKKLPSIYSISTDKCTLVYTMSDNNTFTYVPKWYKVPAGSAFLGNQTVVTFSENRGRILHENTVKEQPDRSQIKDKLRELHNSLTDKSTVGGELDQLVKAKNNENQIYDYLGLNKEKITKEVEKYTGKKREVVSSKTDIKSKPMAYTTMMGEQATNFFATISKAQKTTLDEEPDDQHIKYDMVPRNFNWDIGKERMIKQNMLIGNYEGAIDAALKSGRTAEALIIAYSVDQNTFNSTLKTFFTETTDNFIMDILKYISSKDTDELVKKYDLKKWKECVALIYSLSGVHGRPPLLRLLASRLRAESANKKGEISEANPAIICYILAEDFEEIVRLYFESLKDFKGDARKLMAVEYARRLIAILNSMTRETTESKHFQMIMREVALISIEQNQKVLAYQILSSYSKSSLLWLDYLIHNTLQLENLKDTIVFKGINIPQMPIKKVQKKKENQQASNQAPKKKIFDRKEESEPVQERRQEQLPAEGFAPNRVIMPQSNLKKAVSPSSSVQAPPPPPPPPIIKRPVPVPVPIPQPDKTDSFKSPTKPPLVPKKINPPPPPPPLQHHLTHQNEEEEEEEERPIAKGPVSRNAPLEKKPIPPPLAPPARMQKRQSDNEPVAKMEPPPRRVNPPPPPPSHSQIDEAPNHLPPKMEKRVVQPPPPTHFPVNDPPKRNIPLREEQDHEQAIQEVPRRMAPPPPPTVKKGPPPPPMRK